ncbi:MAG: N-6 DNA methylase [Faecousia sp.]
MLNFDVKKKINTLRDILVGKVPDPKAQVEQITIALIYKFMDDMDLQGAEFGGARVFFSGDYKDYAFSQIMLPEHSAQDRLNLYAEGIDKMTNNPDLPKLFRDILRNAYIPYRDPETLNRFLKEIAEFSYEDSEDLGNAFEYLLSIMGSQGDAGQFRTPRHIIDMMVEITAPAKNESILDPACGTAGFLISAYNYIKKSNLDEHGKSTLVADDMTRMTKNFTGYDISPDMVRLSRVNMYLHGFTSPNISEYDTLTSLEKWDDNFDVIFSNPPFMTPKGGITPHNRYRVSAKRAEVLFVDYIAEHLNPTGRAAIIVPEGIVFQSQTAYKNLRKMLVEGNYLYGVISLPAGVFNPYSGVKTSILLIDKTLAKERDSILFVKLNNDGFDLGAQRREIKGSEIPDVINIFKNYQKGVEVAGLENTVLAKKNEVAQQDYILVGERYKSSIAVNTNYPIVRLGDVCCINKRSIDPSGKESFIYVDISSLDNITKKIHYDNIVKGAEAPSRARRAFQKGDILLSTVRPNLRTFGFVERRDTSDCVASTGFAVITCGEFVNSKYLFYMLLQDSLVNQMIGMMGKGAYPSINQNDVSNLSFPLPPLAVQEEIVTEIESYQKIIDGARQVVENYKPTIKIDPTWESVELGSVASLKYGFTDTARETGDARFIRITDITPDGLLSENNPKYIDLNGENKDYLLNKGDIVVARTGATYGKTALFEKDYPAVFASFLIKVILPQDLIRNEYYWIFAQTEEYWKQARSLVSGGAQPQFNANAISRVKVPVPSLGEQNRIVNQVRVELGIVEQNKRLIEIFQQKIKDKIAEVWGA